MSKVFISYRREDAAGYAQAIYGQLERHLRRDQIFMDVDTVPPGVDFVTHIEHAVSECDVVIALIGKRWMGERENAPPRIHDPEDLVHLEIATALSREIRVIPVLVDGVIMPSPDGLPPSLQPLVRRNALELSITRYRFDLERVSQAVQKAQAPPIIPRPIRLHWQPWFRFWSLSIFLIMAAIAAGLWFKDGEEKPNVTKQVQAPLLVGNAPLLKKEQPVKTEDRLEDERRKPEEQVALDKLENAYREQQVELTRLRQLAAGDSPEIQLLEPKLSMLRGIRGLQTALLRPKIVNTIVVRGRVKTVGGLRLLTINEQQEELYGGNLFKTQVRINKPDQQVRIVAIDHAGRKTSLEFLIRTEPEGTVGHPLFNFSFGDYHALVIGNDDYQGRYPRLQTAVNDARAVADILENLYGFKVKLLLNATRYQILLALNDLRKRLTDKDNLLIYYAGHGTIDQANQRGHWLPVDAEPNISANWISNVSITDILNAMMVRQLLVVSDACFSGTLTLRRSEMGQLSAGVSEKKLAEIIGLMAQKRSRLVMTSGGVEPVPDSLGGKHSGFAQPFINLLKANVGVLPGQEMFQLLQLQMTAAAQRVRTWQAPEYAPIKHAGHESGDFIFVRRVMK